MDNQVLLDRIYNNIESLILINNVQRGEFERAIGVSTGYISRTRKNGDFDLPITKIVAIADYFKITVGDLVYGNYKKAYLIMQGAKIAQELQKIDRQLQEMDGDTNG